LVLAQADSLIGGKTSSSRNNGFKSQRDDHGATETIAWKVFGSNTMLIMYAIDYNTFQPIQYFNYK